VILADLSTAFVVQDDPEQACAVLGCHDLDDRAGTAVLSGQVRWWSRLMTTRLPPLPRIRPHQVRLKPLEPVSAQSVLAVTRSDLLTIC
jgi:hypothetical protein